MEVDGHLQRPQRIPMALGSSAFRVHIARLPFGLTSLPKGLGSCELGRPASNVLASSQLIGTVRRPSLTRRSSRRRLPVAGLVSDGRLASRYRAGRRSWHPAGVGCDLKPPRLNASIVGQNRIWGPSRSVT